MAYLAVSCRVLLALVFVVSVTSKVYSRRSFAAFGQSARRLGTLRPGLVRPVAIAVIAAELAVVGLLASPPAAAGAAGFAGAGLLLTVYCAAIIRALGRGERVPCRCFGPSGELRWRHVARNVGLVGVALLGLVSVAAPGSVHYRLEDHMLLTTLTVLAIALCALTLTVLAAVLVRLREHEQALAQLRRGPIPEALETGARIGAFTGTTVSGERLSRESLRPGTLVGFFDPECEACHEQLPGFLARAASLGDTGLTLAVVGDGVGTGDVVALLGGSIRVLVEPPLGSVQQAFGVRMYPAFFALGDGQVVIDQGSDAGLLTAPVSR